MSKSTDNHKNNGEHVHNGEQIEALVNKHLAAFVNEGEALNMCPECALGEFTVILLANLFNVVAENNSANFTLADAHGHGKVLTKMAYEVYVIDALMCADPLTELSRKH